MDFEKLNVWKRSLELSVQLYQTLGCSKDFGFKDQITRSGLSVPSNIAEGVTRRTRKEKLQFISIARASCAELKTQIFIGIKVHYIPEEVGQSWLVEVAEIHKMLNGLYNRINTDI